MTSPEHAPGSDGADGALPPPIVAGLLTVATIVATVELERVLAGLGRPTGDAAAGVEDPHLGASIVLVDDPSAGRLALAEPTTEGRLAATLARHGEGPCGRYLAFPDAAPPDALDTFRARAADAGIAVSRVADGPFGPSILVLTGPVTGPHLIVAERRPVPSRS